MLEINKWFFVLLANFLVLLYVLNVILFKPLLKVFKERDDATSGSIQAARIMEQERERALDELKAGLQEASRKARGAFESMRAEGLDGQKALLSKASEEALKIADKARADLRAEAEKARGALRADVERLSDEIVKKLVGGA
jgi:F-type H+-transporting ATPase subunit b